MLLSRMLHIYMCIFVCADIYICVCVFLDRQHLVSLANWIERAANYASDPRFQPAWGNWLLVRGRTNAVAPLDRDHTCCLCMCLRAQNAAFEVQHVFTSPPGNRIQVLATRATSQDWGWLYSQISVRCRSALLVASPQQVGDLCTTRFLVFLRKPREATQAWCNFAVATVANGVVGPGSAIDGGCHVICQAGSRDSPIGRRRYVHEP